MKKKKKASNDEHAHVFSTYINVSYFYNVYFFVRMCAYNINIIHVFHINVCVHILLLLIFNVYVWRNDIQY